MLPAWRPVPSYRSTMTIFVVFGIIFLSLGIALYVMSDKIQTKSVLYNTECYGLNSPCYLNFTLTSTFVAPIYVYYELDNFY